MAGDINIKVNLKELEAFIKRYPEASLFARRSRISEATLLLQREIMLKTPEGGGPIHLRDTIFSTISIGEPVWGMVGTPAIYGAAVEYGTKPHPVSKIGQEAILFWVTKKLGLSGKEAKSAAFCIARAIKKRGTKGAHMFEKGFALSETRVIAMLKQIPEDIVRAVNA